MVKFCMVVTIVAGDNAPDIRDLFGLGATVGLKDYVLGRDPDGSGGFDRYVLAQNGVAVTTTGPHGDQVEVDVQVLIAYNANVGANIRTRIGEAANNKPSLIRQLEFNPPLTRPQMVSRLTVEVGQEMACSKFWHNKPGDDVVTGVNSAATLLAKFQNVPTQ